MKDTLRSIRVLNFFRRIYTASTYYNSKYIQILKWGFTSKEDTNFTYDLTEANTLYLSHLLAVVTQKDIATILGYIDEVKQNNELRDDIINTIKTHPFKNIADLNPLFGRRVGWYALVRALKPKVIIETGVDKGLGSVLLCSGLLKNREEGFEGEYYGTDINPKAGYLLTEKYQQVGKILYGDSIKSLAKFEKKIDLFINDSDHSSEYEYQEYVTIQHILSDDAVILGDNAHITDKLAVFSKEKNRAFLYFQENPQNHWYPGAGIGISYRYK